MSNVRSASEVAAEKNAEKLERLNQARWDRFADGMASLEKLGVETVDDGDHRSTYQASCNSELQKILAEAAEAEAKAKAGL